MAARASGRKWPQVAASGRLCQNQIRALLHALWEIYLKEYYLYIYIYKHISELSFSDTSGEREINQEEYIKQKILSCKCSEYATIK